MDRKIYKPLVEIRLNSSGEEEASDMESCASEDSMGYGNIPALPPSQSCEQNLSSSRGDNVDISDDGLSRSSTPSTVRMDSAEAAEFFCSDTEQENDALGNVATALPTAVEPSDGEDALLTLRNLRLHEEALVAEEERQSDVRLQRGSEQPTANDGVGAEGLPTGNDRRERQFRLFRRRRVHLWVQSQQIRTDQ